MKAIAGLSLLLLAGCDKATEPGFAETPEASQHTVAYLKSLCDGRASVAVTQDVPRTALRSWKRRSRGW